ncbi:T9SS type A sorting domain-containing protein [Neolewinella aurantiaca]|uniref:T9SS type A sorting domain-containing protein n=1 Tax=Neolewinella aurantiaca TaxID=2602767 RepID=A0A5C7FG06_9BACT|nr:T9SS type A sorting domain-containing protein [Neolewinella aurantiaca]TXF90129.1 T9SS type A sorting domain-containing protein [Neolewinella aurantiaca]
MKNALLFCLFFTLNFGLSAQAPAEDLRIFPNPVTTTFEIGYSDRVKDVLVINMVGREVKAFDFGAKKKYDIADLPQGMYLVQLKDADDKVIHTQRVKKN